MAPGRKTQYRIHSGRMKKAHGSQAPGAGLPLCFLAILALAVGCSGRSPSGTDTMPSLFAGIDSLRAAGRYEEALRTATRVESRALKQGGPPWHVGEARRLKATLVRILSLPPDAQRELAGADSLKGEISRLLDVDEDYIAAADLAARQLEIRSRYLGLEGPEAAASLDVLGQIAHLSGEGVRAAEYFEHALAIRRARLGSHHPLVAETLNHRGTLHKEEFRQAEAEACHLEALAILEAAYSPDDLALAPVLQSLGSLYRVRSQFDRAERYYSRALRIRRLHLDARSVPVAENLLWLGHSQLCAGKIEIAEESLAQARAILLERNMNLSHAMADVTWFLGMAAWLRDDCAGAVRLWREMFTCQSNAATHQPLGFGLTRLRGLSGEWIDALLCEGREAEAWEEVCRGTGQATQSLLELAVARQSWQADSDTIDALGREVLALRRMVGTRDEATAGAIRAQLPRIDARRMMLEQELISRVPKSPADSLTLERIQAALKPDQAMVGWIRGLWSWTAGRATKRFVWAFVVRREGGVQWIRLGTWRSRASYAEWSSDLLRFDKTMARSSQWPHRVAQDPALDDLAGRVSAKIFSPLMPHLDGITEVVVIGGRSALWPMNIIPECLVDPQGVRLNERFAFSYTPSPWTFVHLADSARGRSPIRARAFVAVADPLGAEEPPMLAGVGPDSTVVGQELAGTPGPTLVDPTLFRSAISGDREALGRLPCLPCSRTEVRRAASLFQQANVLIGPEARESTLQEATRGRNLGILHLATHSFIDVINPGQSALVMATDRGADRVPFAADARGDGLITAEDVLLGWKLDTDLVTLSGCQTSLGNLSRGGEDLGFAQAFLAAGARCLLFSRWKVDDQATALLMGRFYENLTGSHADRRAGILGRPMSKSRALQEAQLWLRDLKDESGQTPFAHPIYWAGFVLTGNAD